VLHKGVHVPLTAAHDTIFHLTVSSVTLPICKHYSSGLPISICYSIVFIDNGGNPVRKCPVSPACMRGCQATVAPVGLYR